MPARSGTAADAAEVEHETARAAKSASAHEPLHGIPAAVLDAHFRRTPRRCDEHVKAAMGDRAAGVAGTVHASLLVL